MIGWHSLLGWLRARLRRHVRASVRGRAPEVRAVAEPVVPTFRYTAEYVRAEVDKDRENLFAPYVVGRSPTWACDPGTKDLICVGYWLSAELKRLHAHELDRRVQENYYNRWSRSDPDYFTITATALNMLLDGQVDRYRRPHRRWG